MNADRSLTALPACTWPLGRSLRRFKAGKPNGGDRHVGTHMLQTLDLGYCSFTALPDLSALTDLKVKDLPGHLKPWEAGGNAELRPPSPKTSHAV